MLRKLLAILLCAALLGFAALAEADDTAGIATPATESPLREILDLDDSDASEPVITKSFVPDGLERADLGDSDRVIINGDSRVTVYDPSQYPYSAIAYMEVHARCGCDWTCSGFMIGPRGLATGAHCLVCTDHHQTADYITMYFGYKSRNNYFYKYDDSTSYWYGTDFSYTDKYDDQWDYGYVLLNKRVGDTTGWFGVYALGDIDIQTKYLTVAGYRDGELKYDNSFATVEDSNIISYEADTLPGNSGGPVFFYTADDIYAVAIHVSESSNAQKNYARRINSWLFDDMDSNGLFN